ncbi:DEP domain-containing protein 1B [Geodia barretti]|uniref:DEP domain-containing protein 1B n=1 Tax=Geodia barretti TaxID=519541 RepID=A0AA35REX0_GEOBA|nr:DEP domain-containing protein 1B [Geodia barretti]
MQSPGGVAVRDMDWETSTSSTGGDGGSSVCSGSACTTTSTSSTESSSVAFKATQMWQELVVGFRDGMPRQRRRVKMKLYDECFTGSEAVQWLHEHLQASGNFGTVSRQQAVKLLQKFQQTNVIKEVRGKYHQFSEDSSRRYSFVTEPGPFNFVEEPSTVGSPLGTRERSSSCSAVVRGECTRESRRGAIRGSTFFGNAHALSKVEEEEEDGAGGKGKRKKARLTLVDTNSGAGKPSPSQVAEIWKELTLTRLLKLIEMPTLDSVLSHDAVDGKNIVQNAVLGLVPRPLRSGTGHGRSHPSRPRAQGPEGCPTDVVTGQPSTFGLESEVLQSLAQYLCALPEPLISTNLYSLHMAVNSLVEEGKPGARDALQLCTLLLPQTNRARIHRVLRAIHKASTNPLLHLSPTQSNHHVMIDTLAVMVLRPQSSLEVSEQDTADARNLVAFMSQHYNHIFKVPDELKQEADKRIRALTNGVETTSGLNETKSFCQRVSQKEYDAQMRTTSQQSISCLLDQITADENMTDREKKQKLKLFQQQYPDIYTKKFGQSTVTTSTSNSSPITASSSSPRMSFTRSWQFHSLRRRSKPTLR